MINFLVLLGLISILASFFTGTLLQQGKFQGAQDAQLAARAIRYNLSNHLQNDEAWLNTINATANTSLECLRNGSSCPIAIKPILVFKNAADAEVINNTNANKGFDMAGLTCDRFNASSGDPTCPIRTEITWEPICTGACVNPSMVKLNVNFVYSTSGEKGHIFNAAKHNITIERSSLK